MTAVARIIEIFFFLFFRANTLFNIWIKYKPRLPEWYYNERLVKVGDALVEIKEYKLALLQCYERYLQQFVSVNLDDVMDDVQRFKSAFFPNGVRDKNAALMFHALQARNVCIYQMVCSRDRNLQNQESLQTCLNALTSLRLTMQVALPQENLCWLIYNGTIHIYTICRHLMVMGQSAKVLEYLLWASICMESSIPLLSVHYLTWRATLYAAVSQCYFDCQAGIHGEIFARRGLIKIDELKQLEDISSSLEHTETEKIFREATLKMSVMIFKRAVYASRKKSNSFRRESKVNPRKAVSWPRTPTERLLVAMFDGAAAQFLAILEALTDRSRNLLPPHPPVPDEMQIRDVTSELFSAGLEILSGKNFCLKKQKQLVICVFICLPISTIILLFSFQNVHPDKEMLVDLVMCLWQKCKMELQQIQTSGSHCLEYIHKHQAYQELILKKIKRNKLSRAIFLMQKAAQKFPEDLTTTSQRQLLEEALTLIEQVEAEQGALYRSLKEAMSSKKKSSTPPPPLLLCRSHCSMTFKPAPFDSDIQVSWYSILGSVAGGSNTKVRLNSNKLQNSGEQIPADGKILLEVQGLDANEKYIFAVAAYSSDGKLIGDAIGQMTKPILAYPPLSATTVRAYLTQAAYQTGNFRLARAAFSPMWDYFVSVSSPLPPNAAVISASTNSTISEKRLCFEAVSQTSPITLHLFLRNIFAVSDINVVEGALFCDSICSNEMFYKEQVARLAECERMTVAIELSNWLNDPSYILQSVVQCYGLLAPLIYHKIFLVPVVQILIKCLAVLQEIPSATLQRRQEGYYESIQHMIACASYHTVLHSWKEYELSAVIINYGKKLLISPGVSPGQPGGVKTEETLTGKKVKAVVLGFAFSLNSVFYYLKTRFINFFLNSEFCYSINTCVICYFIAVLKFRGQKRFLEFFVQLLHKVLNEEKFQCVLEWAEGVEDDLKRFFFLKGKNISPSKKPKASPLKKPTKKDVAKKGPLRDFKKTEFHFLLLHMFWFRGKDKLKKLAHQTLVMLLSKYVTRNQFCQICLEEMPWRSQMNIYLAVAHYHLFKKNLEEQFNIGISGSQHLDSYNILDPEIFSLNNSGTVLARETVEDNIGKPTPSLLEKSEVLAHRGGHWTLLQNACRELWNYTQEFQLIANQSHFHMDAFPITWDFLCNTIWLPFYFASDTIIDMIIDLQASSSLKIVDHEGDFCIPSCLGGIVDENGGSSLHPQPPLDDVNVVDLRWICNLILKTIELLYQMKKWEALVHIAVQFNIFTHERFTEQVSPLLVYAQRQLLERIQQFCGSNSHESHFTKYLSDDAQKVKCKFLFGVLTLNVNHNQAKALVCVPLDVNDTLKCFKETLEKSKYQSRALRHSRKLLSLFLAHTQGILEMNNQRDLKVQALHELGNLHFYAGNKRAAFKYWCQSLDETLDIADALNTWQELSFPKDARDCFAVGISTEMSQKFLSQAGAWGCLHAAVLVAKIAQYITTSKMRLRTKHCYFSAILFKALFRASLPHPTSDYDFVQYETNILIPGIDLFSDRYRADISTVVASLNFIMLELHCAKQNLIILPLFTLYQYIVSEICKDPAKCIEGRILKIKVLADIGFFTEAFNELSLLISGVRIPWKIPAGYRYTEQMQVNTRKKFDSSKSLMIATNLQVLEDTFNWSLSLTMVPLCNQQMMNKLILAKMHLIICLAATINNIPEKVEKNVYSVDNNSLPEPSKTTASNVKGNYKEGGKGILLTEAEESLSYLVQDIQEKYDGDISLYSVEDLEALIEAKLELASISQQRHQAALSVALAFSAIRLLQGAKVFSDSTTESVPFPPRVTAQGHVNVHLWLRCRAMLVTALMTQIHGVGDMKGTILSCFRFWDYNGQMSLSDTILIHKLLFFFLGQTLAEKVASTAARRPLQWLHALRHLESALNLCRASATKKLDMEAELLFQIEQSMKDEVQQKIPEFASMDLFSSYRDFISGILLYLIPFDVTLQSIANLKDMFDLAHGCIITEGSLFDWIITLLH
uniref:Cilia and flagella associated protein 54 n=1 Tax=Taeniopygia guttata TaxID=59729 RepID=H0ZED7_TAEGU